MSIATKASLSAARRSLLELMQRLNFGRVEHLEIRDGDPVLEPSPIVIREVKFKAENGPRKELGLSDFLLKKEVVELFALFDEAKDTVVQSLEIQHGTPFRATLIDCQSNDKLHF